MKTKTFLAALLDSALAAVPVLAQPAGQRDEHHPQQNAASPDPAAAPSTQPGAAGMPGMSMMNMMGEGAGMDMAGMMRMMNMMRSGMGGGMDEMRPFDRIEGRIAFLRAELRITDAQAPVWNAFADALRAQARKLGPMAADQGALTKGPALLDRLDRQERLLSARLDGVRAIRTALTPLLGALSDEQKKTADELLGSQFGMPMAGGSGMGGMMQGGGMKGGMKPGAGAPMQRMGR